MNEALVNGPSGFAPSFDIGGAVEWEIGIWEITAVGINVGENDDGNNFNFFAGQIGYKMNSFLGEGNYRVIGQLTSKEFFDANGDKERRMAGLLSFDQQLGDIFGVWIRFGWQDDKALITIIFIRAVSTSPANGMDVKTTTSVSDMPIWTVKMISTTRRSPRSTGVLSSMIMLPSQWMHSTCKTNTTPTRMIWMALFSVFVERFGFNC